MRHPNFGIGRIEIPGKSLLDEWDEWDACSPTGGGGRWVSVGDSFWLVVSQGAGGLDHEPGSGRWSRSAKSVVLARHGAAGGRGARMHSNCRPVELHGSCMVSGGGGWLPGRTKSCLGDALVAFSCNISKGCSTEQPAVTTSITVVSPPHVQAK